jgi:predicted house-cleaning noncanonical NTP pyrophosphatase (MazG superfamily)
MLQLGQKPYTKELSDKEFIRELRRKIVEEATELDIKKSDVAKELADLLEAVESMAKELGISFTELRQKQTEIRQKWGGFDNRIYISNLELDDRDKWVDYYASEPNRFKEV